MLVNKLYMEIYIYICLPFVMSLGDAASTTVHRQTAVHRCTVLFPQHRPHIGPAPSKQTWLSHWFKINNTVQVE